MLAYPAASRGVGGPALAGGFMIYDVLSLILMILIGSILFSGFMKGRGMDVCPGTRHTSPALYAG